MCPYKDRKRTASAIVYHIRSNHRNEVKSPNSPNGSLNKRKKEEEEEGDQMEDANVAKEPRKDKEGVMVIQ